LRDVSSCKFVGHGEMSTLAKEDLRSPYNEIYVMKYPRPFDGKRVNWEDVNEVIASKIAQLLGFPFVKAEIAYRNGNRGCLMVHFREQLLVDDNEAGAPLLEAQFDKRYLSLQTSKLSSAELVTKSFQMINDFSYFDTIKFDFISMNVFDLLIGNQDRHPYNWQILFKNDSSFFAPLYDNGASLGWQLPDDYLLSMLNNQQKMNKFFRQTKVKAGLFENTTPPLKGTQVLKHITQSYPDESKEIIQRMVNFDWEIYEKYIDEFPLISQIRKKFLKEFVQFRMNKIIGNVQEGDEHSEI